MTPARGRPPATRGVFAIEDPALLFPSTVALDTSFVVEALIETQRLHVACRGFLERLVESDVAAVTNELLAIELAEASFAIALKERWGRRWRRHRSDGRARRRGRRLLTDVTFRYQTLLSSVTHVSVPLGPVTDERHDRLRARLVRRCARRQRDRRARRGDRDHRHQLRAAALVAARLRLSGPHRDPSGAVFGSP